MKFKKIFLSVLLIAIIVIVISHSCSKMEANCISKVYVEYDNGKIDTLKLEARNIHLSGGCISGINNYRSQIFVCHIIKARVIETKCK
jgi:hypothetical protein